MRSLPFFSRVPRIAAAMLLAALCAGCGRPLALQHEFFEPLSGSADRIGTQARHANRPSPGTAGRPAGLWDERGPAPAPAEETSAPGGPGTGFAAASREALATLCAAEERRPEAAYGGASNAYRRWVEDDVRELPEAEETAAPAAGG